MFIVLFLSIMVSMIVIWGKTVLGSKGKFKRPKIWYIIDLKTKIINIDLCWGWWYINRGSFNTITNDLIHCSILSIYTDVMCKCNELNKYRGFWLCIISIFITKWYDDSNSTYLCIYQCTFNIDFPYIMIYYIIVYRKSILKVFW